MGRAGSEQQNDLILPLRGETVLLDTEPFSIEGWTEDRVPWVYIGGVDLLFVGNGGSNHGADYDGLETWLSERGFSWQ